MIRKHQENQTIYRDVITVNNSPLMLSDHGGIGTAPLDSSASVANRQFDFEEITSFETPPVRGIVHGQFQQRADYVEDLFDEDYNENRPDTILLQVSGGTDCVNINHMRTDSIVWLSMKNGVAYRASLDWLREFLSLTFEHAIQLANASRYEDLSPEIRDSYPQLLEIVHPHTDNTAYALARLCEAYLLPQVGKGDKVHSETGLSVHCPDPIIWIDLLWGDSSGQDTEEKIKTLSFRSGRSLQPVSDLLTAIHNEPNGCSIEDSIKKFLTQVEAESEQPTKA